jgi:hypothetical protein
VAAYTGFTVKSPPSQLSTTSYTVRMQDLAYVALSPAGQCPVRPGTAPSDAFAPQPCDDPAVGVVYATVGANGAARTGLFDALRGLGAAPGTNDDLAVLARTAGAAFTDPPLLLSCPS